MFSTGIALAQYSKSDIFEIGGNISYSSDNQEAKLGGTKLGNINSVKTKLEPMIGYFVANSVELMFGMSYNTTSTEFVPVTGSSFKATTNSMIYFLGPMYVFKGKSTFPYAGPVFGSGSVTVDDGNTSTISISLYGLQGGLKVKIAEGTLLNFLVNYMQVSGSQSGSTSSDITGTGLNFGIGLSIYK
jgi:hypothetical protein